jgi:hypothetical protein
MQKFEIYLPKNLVNFQIIIFISALLAFLLWKASIFYRVSAIALFSVISGVYYYFYFKRNYLKKYPFVLFLKQGNWYLNSEQVSVQRTSILTTYYALIHLKNVTKSYYFLVTPSSFGKQEESYYQLIRHLRIHQASF